MKRSDYKWGAVLPAAAMLLSACATPGPVGKEKPIPVREHKHVLSRLGKTDFDGLAEVELRENTQRLRLLMVKLYKRNPRELRKSTAGNAEHMALSVFEGRHEWKLGEINEAQGAGAIHQAFRPDFEGDRVLSFIVGLQTMLLKAHGGKTEFYLTDSIDPQKVYNVARNVEIAVWKLSNARDEKGELYLLSNEINADARNLSFEREFGKIIGSLDLYAEALAEKREYSLVHVVQTFASAIFLPF